MGLSTFLLRASKRMSRKRLYPFLQEALRAAPNGARVLNIGAGGDIEAVARCIARERGLILVSSDIDPKRAPDIVDDITQSNLPPASFDVVILMEVLEHVRDPQAAAREIRRILKPAGQIVLSAPFIYPLHDRPHDYYRFTRYGLAHLFRDFEEVAVSERNSWPESILVLVARLGAGQSVKSRIAGLFFIPLTLLLWPFAMLASMLAPNDFLTTGYVMTARRPAIADAPQRAHESAHA